MAQYVNDKNKNNKKVKGVWKGKKKKKEKESTQGRLGPVSSLLRRTDLTYSPYEQSE